LNAYNPSVTLTCYDGSNWFVEKGTSSLISVKSFGATGDGSTDDATAIQAAIDASVGKTLYVPAGIYRLDTWITLPSDTHIIMDENAVIMRTWDRQAAIDAFGASKPYGATFRNSNAVQISDGDTVTPLNSNITIQGGQFDISSGGTYRGAHILLYNVENCKIQGVQFNDLEQDWAIGVFGNSILIEGNKIYNGEELFEDGIHVQGGEDICVNGNIVNSGDDCIAVSNSENLTIRNVSITGNVLNSTKGFCIKIRSGYTDATNPIEQIVYSGNTGYSGQSRNGNVYIEELAADNDNPPLMVRNIEIGSNSFRMGTLAGHGGAASGSPHAVTVRRCKNITFTGLTIENSIWSSVKLLYARNVKFIGCRFPEPELASTGFYSAHLEDCKNDIEFVGCDFENTSEDVIKVETSQHLSLSGCTLNGVAATFAGIQVDSSGADLNLNNNRFVGTGGTGINIGTANVAELCLVGNNFDTNLTAVGLYSSTQPSIYIAQGNAGLADTTTDSIYIPATSIGSVAGSPSLGVAGSRIPAWLLDASTDEIGGMLLGLNEHPDWNKFKVRLVFTNSPGDTANVVCQYYYEPLSVGDVIATGSTSEAATFAVVTTANEIGRHQFGNTVTITDDDYHFLRLVRDADNAADTYASDLRLIGVELVRIK